MYLGAVAVRALVAIVYCVAVTGLQKFGGPLLAPAAAAAADSRTASPLLDAIVQNTPGYSEGFPLGVPRRYAWWCGSRRPSNPAPPAEFSAVMGWGQIYPIIGATRSSIGTVQIANARTYLRRKGTREWILVQDQATTSLAGAYFTADFSRELVQLPFKAEADGSAFIIGPPNGQNAHFWFSRRAIYSPGTVDGVYVEMDMKVAEADAHLVANVGADWWRNATVPFLKNFTNNPGAGMSNWIVLTDRWSTLRFYSPSTPDFEKGPPAPLAASGGSSGFRLPAPKPSPCVPKPR